MVGSDGGRGYLSDRRGGGREGFGSGGSKSVASSGRAKVADPTRPTGSAGADARDGLSLAVGMGAADEQDAEPVILDVAEAAA